MANVDVELGGMDDDDFSLNIRIEGAELVDDGFHGRAQAVARMLRQAADRVGAYEVQGVIKDISGNTVGSWEFD